MTSRLVGLLRLLPRPLLLIMALALALVLRLSVIAGTWDAQPWGDPADYHVHGATLALAGHYPAATFAEPSRAGRAPCGLRCSRTCCATYEVTGAPIDRLRRPRVSRPVRIREG